MENWSAILEIEKARQREIRAEIRNNHLVRSARRQRKRGINIAFRRSLASFGRSLETLGLALQKKSQTC
jgi:hypothetical protein